jgi:hypothetical protein
MSPFTIRPIRPICGFIETVASLPGYSIIGSPTRPGAATKLQTTKDTKADETPKATKKQQQRKIAPSRKARKENSKTNKFVSVHGVPGEGEAPRRRLRR